MLGAASFDSWNNQIHWGNEDANKQVLSNTMDGVDGFTVENGTVCLDGECMPSDEFRTFVRHSQYLLDVESQNIAIVTLYIPVFLVAAVSNILVIIVIYRFQHLRRSVTFDYK